MASQSSKITKEPARQLAQHYNAITLGGAVALLGMVTVLFFLQFNDLQENQITRIEGQLNDRAESLDSFLRNITFYVSQLRHKAQYHLRQGEREEGHVPFMDLPKDEVGGRFFALDVLPPDVEQEDVGNLFGLGSYKERLNDKAKALEVRTALSLFPLFRATHQALPNIEQSYFQSIDQITAIYPWTTTREILERDPGLTMEQLLTGIVEMEFVQSGRPENNTSREAYWTSVYQDPAGRGLMVTHGAPVYKDNTFLGVVATDVTLNAIDQFVDEMGYAGGYMIVINEMGQVLATSSRQSRLIKAVEEVLPSSLITHKEQIVNTTETLELGNYVLARQEIGAANWSILFYMPRSEFNKLSFYGILGYVVIVLGLCLFLLMVYFVLQRRFVRPALALTDHIRAEAADGQSHVKDVPKIWRPWFQTVSDTFALKHVTSNLPGAVFQLSHDLAGTRKLVFVSHAIQDLAGVTPQALMSGEVRWRDLFKAEDMEEMQEALRKSASDLSHFHFVCQIRTNDGQRRWVRYSSNPRRDERGSIIWEGLILDITKRKLAEEALIASEQRLRSIMDASLFPLVVSRTSDHSVVFINDRALDLFGLQENDIRGISAPNHWASQSQRAEILTRIQDQGVVENQEVELRKKDGTVFWVLMSAIRMTYESIECLLFTYTDITRRKELEDELKRLATTDPLTGANNRRYFLQLGDREWHRAQRGVNNLAVLMMDIDHFKSINDTYGHPGGDEVLRKVVECMTQKIRNIDILGRLGGEEFAIILPNVDLPTAVIIANRLREAIAEMAVKFEEHEISFTMSIGATLYRDGDPSLESLLGRADQALYKAKTTGRNRVVAWE